MKFRTQVTLSAFDFSFNHSDKILMMGSCFTENMAGPLQNSGFRIDVNPFGTVYNPQSLSSCIRELLIQKKYAASDLFKHQGLYHSFSHHSRFSDISQDHSLSKINERMGISSIFLKESTLLIVTFGTSYAYTLLSTRQPVTNCHKLPENLFARNRLTTKDITDDWNRLIREIRIVNPRIRILFTVSPIRHWKDGAHENQLSKAVLLLAVDEIIRENTQCYYFPSYELQLDELRDYRFYAEDMIHPSTVAINYIWERFSETFFSEHTCKQAAEWQNIQKALNHKPFNPESDEYKEFIKINEQRLEALRKLNY